MPQLNERDFAVIDYLKNQGWAMTAQIASRFFAGSRHSCSNRMRILGRAKIVEAVALSEFRNRYWHERAVLNALCTSSGRIQVYRLSESFREAFGESWARQSSDAMVAHQILLSSVQERLESIFPNGLSSSEGEEAARSVLTGETKAQAEMPDLVFNIDGFRIAVELERKARRGLGKLNFAYENRFESLMRSFDAVLYVLEREDHISRIAQKAEGYRRVGFCSLLSLNSVHRVNRETIELKKFVSEMNSGVV